MGENMVLNKIFPGTKAATDLSGQYQQSDEEDEEIHRAHRLQILQHSGSVWRKARSCRRSRRTNLFWFVQDDFSAA